MQENKFKIFFNELIKNSGSMPKLLALIALPIISALIYLFAADIIGLALLAAAMALPIMFFAVINPRFWLYTIIISCAGFLTSGGKGVSGLDVLIGFYFMGSLFLWLFWQVLVKKQRLVRNRADWLIIFFYFFVPANFVVAHFSGVPVLNMVREYLLFSLIMFYLPFREYFNEEKYLKRFLLSFAIVILILDFSQFYMYYKVVFSDLMYAYQLGSSIRVNQPIITSGAIAGMIFTLILEKKWQKLLCLSFTTLTIIALVVTFSRAFWLIFMGFVVLSFLYLPKAKKIELLKYTSLVVILFSAVLFTIFQDKVSIAFTVIEKRLSSSAKGKKDISLQSRGFEFAKVMEDIERYPLGGVGFAKKFVFFDPIVQKSKRTNFTHNAYLFFSYRLGIPLFLIFLTAMLYYTYRAEYFSRRAGNLFQRAVSLSAFAILLLNISANMITTTLIQRDGIIVTAIAYALIGIVARINNQDKVSNDEELKLNSQNDTVTESETPA